MAPMREFIKQYSTQDNSETEELPEHLKGDIECSFPSGEKSKATKIESNASNQGGTDIFFCNIPTEDFQELETLPSEDPLIISLYEKSEGIKINNIEACVLDAHRKQMESQPSSENDDDDDVRLVMGMLT